MDLLRTLDVLVRVVEAGSFSAVARERQMSNAAVTRQIAQLEDYFGVRLFHRTTRKLSLTDDGEMLLGMARPLLDSAEDIKSALGRHRASPIGLVRVGATATVSRFLTQRLPVLLADHPRLRVELVVTDRFDEMIENRLDLAVRLGDVKDASLVVRRAGAAAARVAVAAPSYIRTHGGPATPAELTDHLCIVLDAGVDPDVWSFITPDGPVDVRVSGGLLSNDSRTVHEAARTGYGIAFLSLVEVLDDLQNGALVQVLSDFPAPDISLNLVYPSRRHLAPRTRLVLDFIFEQVKQAVRSLDEISTAATKATG
ncbi:DNA-binding transcriptional LysR family regulator [Bradyrhizobium sp. USDA 4369]